MESGPIADASRVMGIDTARGFALLGIFLVNAATFGEPLSDGMSQKAPVDEGIASLLVYYFTTIFCNGKFFPLFSILFGVGLAMMHRSTTSTGRRFGWIYFRRLCILGLFGASHIVFLWLGDILLIYALVGLWMIWLGRCKPKTLLITAGSLFAIGILLSMLLAVLMTLDQPSAPRDAAIKPLPPAETRVEQMILVLQDWDRTQTMDPRWRELEVAVMREGPFAAAAVLRLINYAMVAIFFLLVMFWVILPCFCVGAALLKLGFLHGELRPLRSKLIWLGMCVGLPLNIGSAIGWQYDGSLGWSMAAIVGVTVGGPMMSLMYLSLVLNWVDSGWASRLAKSLAATGRMALTCYLLESVLMSAVMVYWGLGRFDQTTWLERLIWVVAIFTAIVLFANWWMRRFRFGPLEWLWRVLTYLRWQPLRRTSLVESRETRVESQKLKVES
jgi:uncharacterized protein